MTWLSVAAGGAIGAVLRFALTGAFGLQHVFPWATLTINIAGSLAIGLAWGLSSESDWFAAWGRLFLVVGVLGGFTTFSAFSLETLNLLEQGRLLHGLAYMLASVVGCVASCFVGLRLGTAG